MYDSKNLPLSPKKVIKKTITRMPGAIMAFPAVLGLGILWGLSISMGIALAVLFLIIFIICIFIYEYFYYKLYFYNFGEEQGVVQKGVISRAAGYIRYEKLQNIYVDQDILDRIFGLYDVHYETAGEQSGFYSHVDGLEKANADKLLAFLEAKAKQPIGGPGQGREVSQSQPRREEIKGEEAKQEISISQYPLSKKTILALTIILSFLLFLAYILILFYVNSTALYIGIRGSEKIGQHWPFWNFGLNLGIFAIIIILAWIYSLVWYENFYFRFDEKRGEIRRKVIGQSISYIYYDRIQNVSLNQNILDRLFGIYTIKIETAGERSSESLMIWGLPKEGAEEIRDFLLKKAELYRQRL